MQYSSKAAVVPIFEFSNSCTRGGVVLGEDGNRISSSSSISSFQLAFDDGVEGGEDVIASVAHT